MAQVKTTTANSDLSTAMTQMGRNGVNQLPVTSEGRIVGMLSREDLITFLRLLHELGG